jgi:hypothetical protein
MRRLYDSGTAVLIALAVMVLGAWATPATSSAQAARVDPQAAKILKRMTGYLAKMPRFAVDSENTLEGVLTSGSKIQFDSAASVVVERPNKLRAERSDELFSQIFYYDGKTLTLYNPEDKYYATVTAPDTLEGMLKQDVTNGFVVGKAVVGGVKCDHLAFSGPHVDWQIWIADGDQPLPRKYVITTKQLAGEPQYTVVMNNWNTQPNLTDAEFEFVPPKDAKKIDFISHATTGTSP